jgi:hypothetical protein
MRAKWRLTTIAKSHRNFQLPDRVVGGTHRGRFVAPEIVRCFRQIGSGVSQRLDRPREPWMKFSFVLAKQSGTAGCQANTQYGAR